MRELNTTKQAVLPDDCGEGFATISMALVMSAWLVTVGSVVKTWPVLRRVSATAVDLVPNTNFIPKRLHPKHTYREGGRKRETTTHIIRHWRSGEQAPELVGDAAPCWTHVMMLDITGTLT